MKTRKAKKHQLRLIGGTFRGRVLPILDAEGLRPTTDRVRETLFNWLQYDIAGQSCLDTFSGSGALGFEALSRGAKSVTFCETNPQVQRQLTANIDLLGVRDKTQQATDGLAMLAQGGFDGVFLDPPYARNLLPQALDIILTLPSPPKWIYLEHNAPLDVIVSPLNEIYTLHREKKAGQVYYGLLRKEN